RRRTETDMRALRKTEAVAECFTGRTHRKREGRYRLYLPSLYGFRAVRPRCFFRLSDQYIPPISGAAGAAAGAGSLMSATRDSVVRTVDATEEAFCSAERVTFVGSTMPSSSISP